MNEVLSRNSLNNARIAIVLIFFIHGSIFANWITRIPEIKVKLSLSEGQLGLVLMGTAIGVIVAVTSAGYLTSMMSSKTLTIISIITYALLIIPLGLFENALGLFLGLFLFGYATSVNDIAMNTQAVIIERGLKKSYMSSFHASYSVGGFAGASFGGFLIKNNIRILDHFLSIGIGLSLFGILLYRYLLPDEKKVEDRGSIFRLPEKSIWLLGFIGLLSSIGEGSMADWSAVYLNDNLMTSQSTAALGFAVYSIAMTVGRILGDAIINKFSKRKVIISASLTSSSGFLIISASSQVYISFFGFILIGLGLSVIIPLLFSHAGNLDGIPPGTGIAGIATIGYLGFLSGPPFIGFIAEYSSLKISFFIVGMMLLFMIPASRTLHK